MNENRYATINGRPTVLPGWEHLHPGVHAAVFEIPASRIGGGFEHRLARALAETIPKGMRFVLFAVDPAVPLDASGCGMWTSDSAPAAVLALLRTAVRDVERWAAGKEGTNAWASYGQR